MKKAIITAALTGSIHTPSMSPHLPVTAGQLIDEILAVHAAGGAVAHLHVRDPETGIPNADQDIYREIATEIKKHCDIILCTTTGGRLGEPVEKRVAVASSLKPELASLNAGSLNFALFHVVDKVKEWKFDWEKSYLENTDDFIFPNTFKTMRQFLEIFDKTQTKPEFEIYDTGMINNLAFLIQKGITQKPVYLQFVMGILGGIGGHPEDLSHMRRTADRLFGDSYLWSVLGAGRNQIPIATQGAAMGSNVRVGLEDSLWAGPGKLAESSAQQVTTIRQVIEGLSLEIATPDEARASLALKGPDHVAF